MHGTLEVKQDALTADAVKRPEWMDEVAAEDMTEEQKKVSSPTTRRDSMLYGGMDISWLPQR